MLVVPESEQFRVFLTGIDLHSLVPFVLLGVLKSLAETCIYICCSDKYHSSPHSFAYILDQSIKM